MANAGWLYSTWIRTSISENEVGTSDLCYALFKNHLRSFYLHACFDCTEEHPPLVPTHSVKGATQQCSINT